MVALLVTAGAVVGLRLVLPRPTSGA